MSPLSFPIVCQVAVRLRYLWGSIPLAKRLSDGSDFSVTTLTSAPRVLDTIRVTAELGIASFAIDTLEIPTLVIGNRAIDVLEIQHHKPEIVPASLLICRRRSAALGEQRGPATSNKDG